LLSHLIVLLHAKPLYLSLHSLLGRLGL